MAIKPFEDITPRLTPERNDYQDIAIIKWAGLAAGDEGAPYEKAKFADRSAQVVGEFSGSTVRIQGTLLDNTNYATLTDPLDNDLQFTTPKIEAVTQVTRFIKPVVVGGDAGTAIDVIIIFRR